MQTTKTAKIFKNGASQAVRLPADCRFPDDLDEVFVRKDPLTGTVTLSAQPRASWTEFFALRGATPAPADFMADRPLNKPLKSRVDL
jgi:antitoxin VapB